MPYSQFDRKTVRMKPLASRENRVVAERDSVRIGDKPTQLSEEAAAIVQEAATAIRTSRKAGKPVILVHGAHAIKKGLAPILIALMSEGWVTHVATNGAGIIHDWELAYLGETSEDVKGNIQRGEFGNWEETGFYLNLAINIGAFTNLGYGESVGSLIENECLTVPSAEALREKIISARDVPSPGIAAAADLLEVITALGVEAGVMPVKHAWKSYSAQAAAWRLGIPYTGHPMFGHDIIYNHPMSCGAAVGRCAERDFLAYAQSIRELEGGVYLSIGSAVMSPMIFEKSLSMARNQAFQAHEKISDFSVFVVDLQESEWDWRKGEPPESSPEYYHRFNKTFSRMGGRLRYACADNRDFLLGITAQLGLTHGSP